MGEQDRTRVSFELSKNVHGILWMLLAGVFFSCMVAAIKILGSRLPSFEIVFFRSLLQLLVLVFVYIRIGFSALKTGRPLLQGLRALIGVLLINCNFYAFTQLPLADVTAIGFSRNLFLVLLAIPLLGEKVSGHRLAATIIGFLGILIIIRPGYTTLEGAALIALMGSALGATMMILIRKLTVTDSNIVMMTYPSIAIVLATAIPVMFWWVTPTVHELVLLLVMSMLGMSGQWCLIQAFRIGEATAVAPAGYIRLVFASFLGFYLFAEVPDSITVIGALIIIGSNFYLVYREGRVHKTMPGERVPGDVT